MSSQELNRRRFLVLSTLGSLGLACQRQAESPPSNQTIGQQPSTPERPLEAGWMRFRSLNYPYQMDYPEDWTAQSTQLLGKKVDVFRGEVIDGFQVNVNVLSEPVNSWVTVDDYVQNYLSQVEQIAVSGKRSVLLLDRNLLKGLNRKELSYRDGILYDLIATDVAANITYMVDANINNPLGSSFRYVSTLTAIFVANGQGWQITFSSSTRLGNEAAPLPSIDKFQKMLTSFKFRS